MTIFTMLGSIILGLILLIIGIIRKKKLLMYISFIPLIISVLSGMNLLFYLK